MKVIVKMKVKMKVKNDSENEGNNEFYYEIKQLNNWFKTSDQTKSLEE